MAARGAWRAFALAGLVVGAISGCGREGSPQGAKGAAVPVVVAEVVRTAMPVELSAVGNVEPSATVEVRARVDGHIEQVSFTEGQEVTEGTPLFSLDRRPFAAQLAQAEANLARSRSQSDNARLEESRYVDLVKKKVVSEDQFAQIRTARESAEANVRADEAAIQTGRLQLEYSTVRAPIGGRTGEVLIQRGNLVKANDTKPLVVVNRMDPVYVTFAVPEQQVGAVRRAMERGPVAVRATGPEADAVPVEGRLVFVDNAVIPDSGTLRLKALFDNPQRALWPGQFVTVVVVLGEQKDALVVPSQAIQVGPKGTHVFVVVAGQTVELRPVRVERTLRNQTVVAGGVAPGEHVVTVGQWRLRAGSLVDPRPEASAP
jgi:membrane fusion protein, multidrug efflux system